MKRCFDFMKHFQFHKTLYLLHKNGCKQASFCQLGKGNYIFYISNEFRKEFEKFVFAQTKQTPCMNKWAQ